MTADLQKREMEPTQWGCNDQNMRRAHSEREWPPRSFVVPVCARIAQGQREESARRVEALAGWAERGQAPPLRLSASGQIITPIFPSLRARVGFVHTFTA